MNTRVPSRGAMPGIEERSTAGGAPTGEPPAAAIDPAWAWAEYQGSDDQPWNWPLAGHLYRRAAWGADWETLERAVADGPRRAIDRLLHPPESTQTWERQVEQDEQAATRTSGMESLRAWWLRRMLESPHPLNEKVTLFWHGHFGVQQHRVADGRLMVQYVRTLRTHALGSYRQMLTEICHEPALFLAWGAQANRKMQPNENLPRQLLQRLMLDAGRYTDRDVREAARAFTGWFVLSGSLRFLDHEHDAGSKLLLDREGAWGSEDVVHIVLDAPDTRQRLARELYRWFISEVDVPDDTLLAPIEQRLGADCHLGSAVEMILRSNLFFSPHAYRRRIKSPLEYALGIVVGLETRLVPTSALGGTLARLGQDLYSPPTTRGWMGGEAWIDAASVLERERLAAALLAAKGPLGGRLDPGRVVARQAGEATDPAEFLTRLWLQDDVPPVARQALRDLSAAGDADRSERARTVALAVVTLPEFHLC